MLSWKLLELMDILLKLMHALLNLYMLRLRVSLSCSLIDSYSIIYFDMF